ncbi:hypothetical protein A2335_00135 [Candidatus Peregrinibacteria bacterium RIFOXYB2_FULL_32_7]|nr:MAG: hypothetical protein A2335_00135 [Candidatus Peregrinibacteria bacterium RIFOXYB2_FULL_32_7]
MQHLTAYLQSQNLDADLIKILCSFADATEEIAHEIHFSDGSAAGTTNIYGEEQLALDIQADQIMEKHFRSSEVVYKLASEERENCEILNENGEYSVAYDPLDGSSLVNVNFAVGSILAIFKDKDFIGKSPREMKGTAFTVYGPRTTIVLSIGTGTHEFTLCEGKFILTRENLKIQETAKNFAPGNLKACKTEKWYKELVDQWIMNGYKLRYSGGMVPDINHILIKGQGIFAYPSTDKEPDGKLRLLIECGPMAYLIENAGGEAYDGKIKILDKKIEKIDQRTPIFIGSKEEVEKIIKVKNK